ncbi:MAG TPA: diguanylate cyclase [Spongiibacteraceae bacterium]|jgi:diguanylate cyclase|nr:diguanylate cyclase [Spongiibacteraceae bacterium]HUH38927.1 diguanylate cyclase [Spongiibacteraceae bacterium]
MKLHRTHNSQGRGRRLVQRFYLPRIVGMGLGFFCVAAVLVEQSAAWWYWPGLIVTCFVWPHLAYQWSSRSEQPYLAEQRNFVVDSLLGGFWIPVMQFNILPSTVIVAMMGMNNLGVGGPRMFVAGLLAQGAGAALAWALLGGFSVQLDSSMAVVWACLPMILLYPLALGSVTYVLAATLGRQKRELQSISRIDGLSGLYNRMYLEKLLAAEFERCSRAGHVSSLILLDIDNFKDINDRYGHAAGDEMLKSVANLLMQNVRNIDQVGRYGGEEFAVLLPDASLPAAQYIAERLRTVVSEQACDRGGQLRCTVSLGVAQISPSMTRYGDWLKAADRALYRAKDQGRNRTVVSDDTHPSTAAERPV